MKKKYEVPTITTEIFAIEMMAVKCPDEPYYAATTYSGGSCNCAGDTVNS